MHLDYPLSGGLFFWFEVPSTKAFTLLTTAVSTLEIDLTRGIQHFITTHQFETNFNTILLVSNTGIIVC